MNQYEFILAIIMIVTIGSILRAKMGLPSRRAQRDRERLGLGNFDQNNQPALPRDDADSVRLREEVKMLKERVQTLERIAVDKENSLAREIDSLRDR